MPLAYSIAKSYGFLRASEVQRIGKNPLPTCSPEAITQELVLYSRRIWRNFRRFGEIMEKDEKACSLILTLFAMLLFLLSTASCASLLIGQAAADSAQVVVGVAAVSSASAKEHDEKLKTSVKAFNEAFRSEDYTQASVFVSPDKKEEFWSEADRFQGKIRLAEYELRDMQLDEKKNHATVILYFQYWRIESQIVKTVSFTQKWQYFEKDKTWRVSDSGFEAFPSNSY
jgi:hypothetical protein